MRQERSRPIVEALHGWLHDQVKRVSGVSGESNALRDPALAGAGGVPRDRRVEMDTNVVERAIRPNTLITKNALPLGRMAGRSTGRWQSR